MKMKTALVLIAFTFLAGCKNVPLAPRPITQVVNQALEYTPSDEFKIVARKVGRPMNKSRIDYWESTTIALTPRDFAKLIEQLKSDTRFALTGFGDNKYYERNIGDEVFIKWQTFAENEVTFNYSERKR
ncbi:MAG: hypothetical protein RIQ79_435 [Verrucomicrobiota bacterium]|jgi:hypothetical protein